MAASRVVERNQVIKEFELIEEEEIPIPLERQSHDKVFQLVGKLWTEKSFNSEALFRTLSNVWNLHQELDIAVATTKKLGHLITLDEDTIKKAGRWVRFK
ncbi:hypothetical protein Ancab_039267, partial [Ancistrocladus abbreviatus]